MENRLTEKESLDLITSMIENAKGNVRKGLGDHFLLWGYLVCLAGLWQFFTMQTELHSYSGFGWLFMIPIGLVGTLLINRKFKRQLKVYTYTDALVVSAWRAFGISMGITLIPAFGLMEIPTGGFFYFYVTLLLLASVAVMVSGTAYRFRPLQLGAVVCWVCALICYFVSWKYNVLLYVIAFFLAYIIPGHLINRKGSS